MMAALVQTIMVSNDSTPDSAHTAPQVQLQPVRSAVVQHSERLVIVISMDCHTASWPILAVSVLVMPCRSIPAHFPSTLPLTQGPALHHLSGLCLDTVRAAAGLWRLIPGCGPHQAVLDGSLSQQQHCQPPRPHSVLAGGVAQGRAVCHRVAPATQPLQAHFAAFKVLQIWGWCLHAILPLPDCSHLG